MCTGLRFTDAQGNLYFGRNLDVPGSYGQKVMVCPRNYTVPMKHIDPITTTKAIIGMGITAGNYPLFFDAANENGLAIANLNFPTHMIDGQIVDTLEFYHYNKDEDSSKTNVTSYEFMIWILENFNTVDEIKNFDLAKNLNFVDTPLNEHMGCAPAHWLISDKDKCIVVEPRKDGVKVFDNPVGVLTNDPSFDWHLMNLNQYLGLNPIGKDPVKWGDKQLHALGVGTGAIGMPGDWTPASRFVKVAYVNHFYPQKEGEVANVSRFFNTLKSVAMPEGSVQGEVTIYSSCFSAATMTYYYDTNENFTTMAHKLTEEAMNASTLTVFE